MERVVKDKSHLDYLMEERNKLQEEVNNEKLSPRARRRKKQDLITITNAIVDLVILEKRLNVYHSR